MTYYGYARVSTEGQSDTSLDVQIEYLRLQAQALGMPFVAMREKRSGKNVTDRPTLNRALQSLNSGDVLGVYDNSRLGRSTAENLRVVTELHSRGVQVQISGKTVDPNNPDEELLFTIQSSISTYQRKAQNLKSRAGINITKRNGDWVMRGDLYGYRLIRQGSTVRAEIDENGATVIRYIYDEYLKGKSIYEITATLNESGHSPAAGATFYAASIRRYLFKPIYMGYYFDDTGIWKKSHLLTKKQIQKHLIKSNIYPALVSEQQWWEVRDNYRTLTRSHSRQFAYRWADYELSSVVECGYCASRYVHSWRKSAAGSVSEAYTCQNHTPKCGATIYTLPAEVLQCLMRVSMLCLFADPSEIHQFFSSSQEQLRLKSEQAKQMIEAAEAEQLQLNKRKENLLDAVETGSIPISDVRQRIEQISQEHSALSSRIHSLSYSVEMDEAELESLMRETSEEEVMTFVHEGAPVRRAKYLRLVERCAIYASKLVIRYKNGKTFVVDVAPNVGRRRHTVFQMRVMYRGAFQYAVLVDTKTQSLIAIPKPSTDAFVSEYNRVITKTLQSVQTLLRKMVECSIIEASHIEE